MNFATVCARLSVLIYVVALGGCATTVLPPVKPVSSIVGTWKMDTSKLDKALDKGALSTPGNEAAANLAKGLSEAISNAFALKFNDDKTCEFSMFATFPGTYVIEGHTVKIHLKDQPQGTGQTTANPFLGAGSAKPDAKDMVATINDDGSKMSLADPSGSNGEPMVFIRDKGTEPAKS